MKKERKRMPLAVKFHLLLVLPLTIVSVLVVYVTNIGLEKNAEHLTDALRVQAKTNQILPLLLSQDDASKAMLINPDLLDQFSEKKVEAYDEHKELLEQLATSVANEEMRAIIQQLFKMDAEILRPIDTKILEQMFDDVSKARITYFEEYEPERVKYEGLIRTLGKLGATEAATANIEMATKNQRSIFQIAAALIMGIIVVVITIIVLSRQIEKSEFNMKSLLAGLNEGVFYFDSKGLVAKERSEALGKILPGSSGYTTLHQFADVYGGKSEDDVNTCLGLLWQEDDGFFSDFDTTVSMLPQETTVEKDGSVRNITFDYKELDSNKDGQMDKVIVFVADVTEKLRNEKEARVQAERVRKVSKAASNTESFISFVKEAVVIFKRVDEDFGSSDYSSVNKPRLMRDLHTLKGSVGTYEFVGLAKKIHELEDILNDEGLENGNERPVKAWDVIKDQWKFETSDIEDVLGLKEQEGKVAINQDKMVALIKYVRELKDNKLKVLIAELTRYNLKQIFSKYEGYLDKLASRRDDKQVRISYVQDSSEVSFREVQQLDGAFVHIFRNCLDHGIETEDAREKSGKSVQGNIYVAVYRKPDNSLHFIIKDDGGGIDGEKLAAKAVKSEIWTEAQAKEASDQDKIELIFKPNLSSKDAVTDVSGRGVGMDAVRATVEEMGGKITVFSKVGMGTQFEIDVPNKNRSSLKAA